MIITPNPKDNYLEIVRNILDQHPCSKFKVILPTVATCMRLQQIIVDNSPNKAKLLPQIVPIINVGIESENLYQIPNENIEPISRLEQRILIAGIIRENSDVEITQALELSIYIMKLFEELIDSNVSIEDLSAKALELDISEIWHDLAEHWHHRSDFLKVIYSKWQEIQQSQGKIDFASFRQHMIKIEIEAAKSQSCNHILAGIFPQSPMIQTLCDTISESSNSYLITPPFSRGEADLAIAKDFKIHHYHPVAENIAKWKGGGEKSMDRQSTSVTHHHSPLTRHPNPLTRHPGLDPGSINYETLPNIYIESKRIIDKVSEILDKDEEAEIAIVTKNSHLINLCSNRMDLENIKYANYSGFKLSDTKIYEYFIALIEAITDDGKIDREKFLILLKTKYLYSEENLQIELTLRKEGKLVESDVTKNLRLLRPNLRSHIEIASKLAPSLWQSYEGKVLGDFLYELLEIALPQNLTFAQYKDFIKSVSLGVRYHKNFGSNNVFFVSLEDADLCSFEYVICCDMNEDSLPGKLEIDPWMNSKMRENLGLRDKSEKMGIDWYHFKNLLHRKYLYLTRSEKKNGTETHVSRFLRELEIGEKPNAA